MYGLNFSKRREEAFFGRESRSIAKKSVVNSR